MLVVAIGAATLLVTVFFTLGQKKIYRASTTIVIDPNPPRPLGNEVQSVVDMGAGTYLNNREYYETQYRIIASARVAKMVVSELGLQRDAAFLYNAKAGETPPPIEVPVESAAAVLMTRLEVEPIKSSRLTVVSFEDADPARAERIVSMVVDKYREQNLDGVLSSTNSAVDWLTGQLTKLKSELEDSELALHQYKKTKNILSLSIDDQSNMLREEMTKLNDTLTGLRSKRENIAARSAELQKIAADNPSNLPASELLNDPVLQTLRREYVDALRVRDGLMSSGKGANHPEVASAATRVGITRNALLGEVKNIQKALQKDLAAVTRETAGVRKLYESANKRALELNLLEIEYNRLHRTKANTEKMYTMVLDRTKESDLTLMLRVNNIGVVDPAVVPKEPIRPRVPLNVGLGLLLGLAFGLAVAMGREFLDRSVKVPEDIETEIGLNFLGLIPQVNDAIQRRPYGRKRGKKEVIDDANMTPELIVHEHPTSGVAEAARALRTNILFMSPDEPYRTLLVTSAAPFEGKTTIATCIAIAMAQAGQRVILVDCDMRRPRLHKIFRRSNSVGLTSTLLDSTRLESMELETEIPNLSVLPCGPIPPNPAELIHSEAFGRTLGRLREKFDRVILDCPPLLPVTDAAILSTRVDGAVIVIRAFTTTKEGARRAARSIKDVGGKIIGAVLNAVDISRRNYGYYDYYYAKEPYGSPSETEEKKAS